MTDDNEKAGQVQSKLSAGGTKRDVENTPKLYPGPTIQSSSVARSSAEDLVEQLRANAMTLLSYNFASFLSKTSCQHRSWS